jgi:hypothetical protein
MTVKISQKYLLDTIAEEGKSNVIFLVKNKMFLGYDKLTGLMPIFSEDKLIHKCIITEDPKETRYKLEENYKVTLKSLDDGRTDHYYLSDLISLINQSSIIMEIKPAFLN